VVATVFANMIGAALVLAIQELTAARRARTIAVASLAAAPLQLIAAATASVTEAFARPLSLAVGSGALLAGCSRSIAAVYSSGRAADEPVD
ncbi:MAG: hypothetical protein QNJ81_09850, partial [Acidimicrobiia bacterium]|nr:hypothetical protein [Acidimicrobiia bacterium]